MWVYAILGVIQGIFEWIPISSEGILAIVSQFLIEEVNPVQVALFLHLGTLFAVLVYFRKDWQRILTLRNSKLLRFLIISTAISLAVGFPLYKLVKDIAVGNGLLLVMGLALLATAYFHKTKRISRMGFEKLAVIVGFLQGLAVIPGLSRSGSTIFGLSLGKFSPTQILKISYMMSAPVVLASSAYLFLENPTLIWLAWPSLVSSFFVGFFTLHFLIKLSSKINFFKFALIFALLCFIGAGIGLIF